MPMMRDERRQAAPHEFAARLADDVADEEQAGHAALHGNVQDAGRADRRGAAG